MHSPREACLIRLLLLILFIVTANGLPIPRPTCLSTSCGISGPDEKISYSLSPLSLLDTTQRLNTLAREIEVVTLCRRNKFTDFFKHLFHKIGEGFHKMADGIKHVAHKIGEGFHKMAEGIKHVAHKIGEGFHKMANGIKHVAHKIKEGFQKAGAAIARVAKKAVHAVKHFITTTGAKIAKVGLKIISTVQKAVSKVVQFIPIIGKPLSKVMDAEAEGENKLSDKIKAHIGGKLGKAMDNMSKAQKYMGFVPRDVVDVLPYFTDCAVMDKFRQKAG